MKLHYFDDLAADPHDLMLQMAIGQGYVPATCLLAGRVVMADVNGGRDACAECNGPRARCHGRPRKRDDEGNAPAWTQRRGGY